MRRREFLRYGGAFAAFTAASTSLPSLLAAQTTDPGDAPSGEEADFDLEIVDVDVELIDGSVVPMYAFAHTGKPPTIPGPILRVKQGDTVRIDIRNSSSGPMVSRSWGRTMPPSPVWTRTRATERTRRGSSSSRPSLGPTSTSMATTCRSTACWGCMAR